MTEEQSTTPLPTEPASARPFAWQVPVAITLMCLAMLFTFRSPDLFNGNWRIEGTDYEALHRHRIAYAQQAWRERGTIPSWFSREFLGSPFWSNLQNFPLIPTRLIFLALDTNDIFTLEAYTLALLAAIFTYLYARRIGVGIWGSAVAGFTFACSGFYTSRMRAGQIGILEVYPSLPIMFWLVRHLCQKRNRRDKSEKSMFDPRAGWLLALALVCMCFVLAAHPQIFIYSLVSTAAYLFWRCSSFKLLVRAGAAIALGLGLASFMLFPMSKLVARSSRMLHLAPATNDLPLDFGRLAAMVFPWKDGAPPGVNAPPGVGGPLSTWPSYANFWDTVNYVGWLPIIAVFILLLRWLGLWRNHSEPQHSTDALFIALLAIAALLLALPLIRMMTGGEQAGRSVILLRSPARLTYLVTFALALASGAVLDLLQRFAKWLAAQWSIPLGVALILPLAATAAHGFDLYRHDRCYIFTGTGPAVMPEQLKAQIRSAVADGRIGTDKLIDVDLNRTIDDIGVFDSILLATTYQTMLDMMSAPPDFNDQTFDAFQMPLQTLRECAVNVLLTTYERHDLTVFQHSGRLWIYQVPGTGLRVLFFPASNPKYLPFVETRFLLRTGEADLREQLLLHPEAKAGLEEVVKQFPPATSAGGNASPSPTTEPTDLPYTRVSSDRFEFKLDRPAAGFVRILEGFDIGWRAMIDGKSVPIFPAHNMTLAIPVPAGQHELVVEFFTPGRKTGIVLSIAALGLLVLTLLNFNWLRGTRS